VCMRGGDIARVDKGFHVLQGGAAGLLLLLPQPAAPMARTVTAIANRFIAVLLLVSQYIEYEGQREDDCESERAGIEIRQVQNFRLRLKPM